MPASADFSPIIKELGQYIKLRLVTLWNKGQMAGGLC